MIEIYFDGILIDNDNYADIKNDFNLFDETFKLGTTTANTFDLVVPFNSIQNIPQNVVIKIDNENYATLIVDSYEIQENNMLSLKLIDKMVLLNFNYDASSIVPCTLKDILEDICFRSGIELGTQEFLNDNMEIDYYDGNITAREYIGYIAEINGGYAQIGADGKLYLKKFNTVKAIYNTDECCESFNLGEKHTIERVVFDNGLLKFESSTDEELETLYLNSSNVFLNTQNVFDDIVEQILGLEYYCIEVNNCIINSNVIAGDLIKFVAGLDEYITIAQYSLDYNGSWQGDYSLKLNSQKQEETKQMGIDSQVKSIKVILNRNDNTLREVVSAVDTIEVQTNDNTSNINNNYQEIIGKFDGYTPTSQTLQIEQSVSSLQTNTYTKTEINTKLTDGSVTKVQTTSGIFDENGMHYEKTGAKTSSTINEKGVIVNDTTSSEELLFAGFDENINESIVRTENLTVRKYFQIGTKSRFEDFEDGTGVFIL